MTPRQGARERAARKQLRSMKAAGELDDAADAALIDLVLGLAKAIDDDPEPKAALWKEYREALSALREAGDAHDRDDGGEVLELVQIPLRPKVGDSA